MAQQLLQIVSFCVCSDLELFGVLCLSAGPMPTWLAVLPWEPSLTIPAEHGTSDAESRPVSCPHGTSGRQALSWCVCLPH